MAVADVLDLLRCPVCGEGLEAVVTSVRCPRGHAFDLARQGYLNLLGSRPPRNADTAAMVAARDRFLRGGHYAPVAEALVEAVREAAGRDAGGRSPVGLDVLEVGAGTAYHLSAVLDALPGRGVALDVSVAAARVAARAHPRVGAVVADVWQPLPLATATIDAVVCVFAPRHAVELARVLRPAGVLVVVSPLADHLAELRSALGLLDIEPDKQQRLAASLGSHFEVLAERQLHRRASWSSAAVADLVAMGPNAFHQQAPDGAEARRLRISALPEPVDVGVAVTVSTWRRRPEPAPALSVGPLRAAAAGRAEPGAPPPAGRPRPARERPPAVPWSSG